MKQLIYMVFAAILGGFVALQLHYQPRIVESNISPSVRQVSNVNKLSGVNFDFVTASERSRDAVVGIQAAESRALAQQRYQEERQKRRRSWNPWEDFFGTDDFWGPNFFAPKEGKGSGVIISEDGYIVTNNHVVGFADNIQVTLSNGKQYEAVKIGTDPGTDLAVIKIQDNNLPTVGFGNSDDLNIGEWVLAVGNPFGYLTSTVTAGIVSAKGRDLDIIKGERTIEEFIQTDAAVNPGNSGGALVNLEGELVGINTAIATPTGVFAGYSFAIPSLLVKEVIEDIIAAGGDIDRKISLGIAGYDVNEEIISEFNINTDKGFYIDEVDRGSAASLAGLLPGDVVVGINGEEVISYDDIKEATRFNKVGDTIRLKVNRQGKEQDFNIKLRKGL